MSQSSYNGNTIASLINQSSTTIDIKASKINLSGAVTVLDELSNNLGFINAGRLYGQKVDIDLTNGNFTLNGSGGQVIIDGKSNMFKIHDIWNHNGNAGNTYSYTPTPYYHGLGYVPAIIGFQVDSPSSTGGNTHLPAFGVQGAGGDSGVMTTSIIRCSADQYYIYLNYIRARPTPGGNYATTNL